MNDQWGESNEIEDEYGDHEDKNKLAMNNLKISSIIHCRDQDGNSTLRIKDFERHNYELAQKLEFMILYTQNTEA